MNSTGNLLGNVSSQEKETRKTCFWFLGGVRSGHGCWESRAILSPAGAWAEDKGFRLTLTLAKWEDRKCLGLC